MPFSFHRTDPTVGTWATTWMSSIALAILVISLISGAIFALYWARKNKRNMKAAYPGKKLRLSDKGHFKRSNLVILVHLFIGYFCFRSNVNRYTARQTAHAMAAWQHSAEANAFSSRSKPKSCFRVCRSYPNNAKVKHIRTAWTLRNCKCQYAILILEYCYQ